MDAVYSIGNVRNLAYRCKNRDVVQLTTWEDAKNPFGSDWDYARVLRAHALFELHKVEEMNECLKQLVDDKETSSEVKQYCTARQDYYRRRYDDALVKFKLILQHKPSQHFKFRALLGIANVYYSQGLYREIPAVIESMQSCDSTQLDDQLSLLMLKANYFRAVENYTEARQTLKQVLKEAIKVDWNFFVIRALFSMAQVDKSEGNQERMKASLDILSGFIDEQETIHLTHLINEQFKEESFAIKLPITLDTQNMRITIDGRIIALHEKPLLFRFLELLSRESQFVSKEAIAKSLWPEEFYHPTIHDARIFDIAKRTRGFIERYEEQPVVLLSGRLGYKLATRLDH